MVPGRLLLGYALMLVTAIGWAGAWITAKAAAHAAPALSVTVGRFGVAAVALVVPWIVMERGKKFRLARRDWGLLVAMSLTGTILYTVLFLRGVSLAPASDGAILTPGLAGVFALVLSSALALRAPEGRALLGAGLSLGGCFLVGWTSLRAGGPDSSRLLGDVLFILGALSWAVYTVLGKRAAERVPAVTGILLVSALGATLLAPVALWVDGAPRLAEWSPLAIGNVVYLGLGATAVAFVTFYLAVRLLGIERAAPTLGLVPVLGVIGAAVFLGERITPLHAMGGLLVVAGIAAPALASARGAPRRERA